MDVLIIEPLDAEVHAWLAARRSVRVAPELARDPRALRQTLFNVRALIAPSAVSLDAATLHFAPVLRAVGRLSSGSENIDIDACARAGVEVVRPVNAGAGAEAEFMIGALLQMLRRVPVESEAGQLVGRELGGSVIGLVGMTPAARPLAHLLDTFGAKVIGYDPALHSTDPLWQQWEVQPVPLKELVAQADGLCVMLNWFSRYRGLLGERVLPTCKPNQVVVSLTPSGIFDELALAAVLAEGRMAAAWLDSVEPGALDPGRPLHTIDTLQITPQVAATTLQSRQRSAWAVARRIDQILSLGPVRAAEFKASQPSVPIDLEAGPAPA